MSQENVEVVRSLYDVILISANGSNQRATPGIAYSSSLTAPRPCARRSSVRQIAGDLEPQVTQGRRDAGS
jgi:hypothetical protein